MLKICSGAHTFALPIQLQLSQQPAHAKDLLHIHLLSAIQMKLNQPTAHAKDYSGAYTSALPIQLQLSQPTAHAKYLLRCTYICSSLQSLLITMLVNTAHQSLLNLIINP